MVTDDHEKSETSPVRARSHALLKAVMNTAVADEVIDSNPCRISGAANTPRAWEIRPTSEGSR